MDAEAAARNAAHCAALLRQGDPDRWLASLFVPAERRPAIHALYAFNLEVARTSEAVSEPMLGEIRLQWWRDAIEGRAEGDARANPVAGALFDAIARHDLPVKPLLDLIEARAFDLYDDPMPTRAALDAYCRATASGLFRLAAAILDGEAGADGDAAEPAGLAYALTGLLRAFPWNSARGRLFLPPLDVLAAHGLDRAGAPSAALDAALAEMRAAARRHLAAALARVASMPERARPAFLPLALCAPCLGQMEKPGYRPFDTAILLPQWHRQWTLWRAARAWG